MRYTDDLIEEIRSRNDIVDVISGYVKLQRRGSSYFGLCPFHQERSPSFSVSPDKQMYYCFGCGAGGNVYTFLMQYENYTFQEAIQALADRAGIKLPEGRQSREEKERADKKSQLLDIHRKAAAFYYHKLRSESGQQAMRYLLGRGLKAETIHDFGLGYAGKYSDELYRCIKKQGYADPLLAETGLFRFDETRGVSDRFWNRVMYPIMDANSRVIGFGGRVMGDGKPKYLNSPETLLFDKSRNLYGLHMARKTKRKNFIICEGYMDVISMHQAGYTNAVASLGTALTVQQCSLISRYTKEVLVIYDMDEAGVRAALRAIPMLREAGLQTKVVNLRPHKDPDEFLKTEGKDAFAARLEAAEDSFLFALRMQEKEYDLQDPQGRSRFFHAAADRLLGFEDEIERDSYIRAVARRYAVDEELLRKQVAKQSLAGTGRREIPKPEKINEPKMPRKEKAEVTAQKLMLTWLASWPELVQKLKHYLGEEDFTTPLYREVAGMVFRQATEGKVSPAEIINHFQDEEQQKEVASLFHAVLPLDSSKEREKAFSDVFFRLKISGLQARMRELEPTDLQGVIRITEEKKKLDHLRATGLGQLRLFSQ